MVLDFIAMSILQTENNISTVKERVISATDCKYFLKNFSFPCFDQPDIKAPLKFQIVAPKDWTVVSNEPVQIQQPYSFPAF